MKKMLCMCFFAALFVAVKAQNVEKMCCQNVDFYLMSTEMSAIDSTSTMIDLSLQTPKLTTIPDEVLKAKNVTYLNVAFNRVGIIPEGVKDLQKLECLDLSGNHYLTKLPDFFNEMPNLKVIRLVGMMYWSDAKKDEVKKQFPNILIIFKDEQ